MHQDSYILQTRKNEKGNLTFFKEYGPKGLIQYIAMGISGDLIGMTKKQVLQDIDKFLNVGVSGNSIYPLEEFDESKVKFTFPSVNNRVPYVIYGGCYRFRHEQDVVKVLLGKTKRNISQAKKELKRMYERDMGFDYYGIFVVCPAEYDTQGRMIADGRVVYAWFGSGDDLNCRIKGMCHFDNLLEEDRCKEKWYINNIIAYYQRFEESANPYLE